VKTLKERKKRMKFAGGVVAMLAVATVSIIALVGGASASGTNPPSEGVPAVKEQFSVLKDATPERVQAVATPIRHILESQGSIEAIGSTSGVVLADVSGGLCAFKESLSQGGGVCGNPSEAFDGQLLSVGFCGAGTPEGTAQLFGVMPDGVSSVALDGTGNRSQNVQVIGNVYEVQVAAVNTTLSATGPNGGAIEIQLPLAQLAQANSPCAQH